MPPKKTIDKNEKKGPAPTWAQRGFVTGSSRRSMWTGIPTGTLRTALGHSTSFAKRRNLLQLAESIGKDIYMETPLSVWQRYNESLDYLVSTLRSDTELIRKLANTVAKKRAEFRVAYLSKLETLQPKVGEPIWTQSNASFLRTDSLEPLRPISPVPLDTTEASSDTSPLLASQDPRTPPKKPTTTTVPPAPVKLERSGRASRTQIGSMLAQHPPGSPGLTATDLDITQLSW